MIRRWLDERPGAQWALIIGLAVVVWGLLSLILAVQLYRVGR